MLALEITIMMLNDAKKRGVCLLRHVLNRTNTAYLKDMLCDIALVTFPAESCQPSRLPALLCEADVTSAK